MKSVRFWLLLVPLLFLGRSAAPGSDEKAKEKPKPAPAARAGSPEVQPDRHVTFRLRAPNAKSVRVEGELPGGAKEMTRDEQGVWSVTVGPLPPELYGYGFNVDGLRVPDPGNSRIKPQRSPTTSILDIPGDPPLIHDFQDVPRGAVRLHTYRSRSLGGALRHLRVYTPPGYDANVEARYPVLYLFHGAGDNEATWTELGRANVILDNLIAQKKARPMLVAMPDGHASAAGPTGRNVEDFERDLLNEVVPLVEKGYRVKADRQHRAIIGLSMGGGQSLTIGLNHLDLFAWVGGMSSYVPQPERTVAKAVDDPAVNEKLRLLWIAIGKDDFLIKGARQLDEILNQKKVKHEFLVTEGNHSWPVWRRYLAQFAPLLFTDEK
jgi:enterochelin esterase family protein